jgi:hypothetical protein
MPELDEIFSDGALLITADGSPVDFVRWVSNASGNVNIP